MSMPDANPRPRSKCAVNVCNKSCLFKLLLQEDSPSMLKPKPDRCQVLDCGVGDQLSARLKQGGQDSAIRELSPVQRTQLSEHCIHHISTHYAVSITSSRVSRECLPDPDVASSGAPNCVPRLPRSPCPSDTTTRPDHLSRAVRAILLDKYPRGPREERSQCG